MREPFFVLKASGEREPFKKEKLLQSLMKAGASKDAADVIVGHIMDELQDGMSTTHIYRHAFTLLRKLEQKPVAARYSIRRAVFGLGPSGFPFEDYVSEIFKVRGYAVEVGKIVDGECATHEVDLLAFKGEESLGIELKFHNSPGIKTDLKVALYVRERFEDIKRASVGKNSTPLINQGMLITNTKFTSNAIHYSTCVGLKLLGWNYPRHGHLEDLIRETGIYPITTLTTLSQKEKISLLSQKVVMCNKLESNANVLQKIGIPRAKIGTILEESQALCSSSDVIK